MKEDLMNEIQRIAGVNPRKCMRCGKCSGACPAYDEMEYHPHQFVSMVENGRIDELMASKGIYTCLSCFACVERCPRNVEPAKLIEAVRLAVIRQQGMNHLAPEQIPELGHKMAASRRFSDLTLCAYVSRTDEETQTQFSALTALLPDKTAYIAFRGTDDTIVGWKEDFNLAFLPVVPAQRMAAEYLAAAAAALPSHPLRVGGHSKGGNLAVYSAVFCGEAVQNQLMRVYNNDGPGFRTSLLGLPEHRRVADKITTILPESSVVGMLLEHEERYEVVRSTQSGLWQHDGFSWQVRGEKFEHLPDLTEGGKLVDETIRTFILSLSPEQRVAFTDALFDILTCTDAGTLTDLKEGGLKTAAAMLKKYRTLDKPTRSALGSTLRLFMAAGAKTAASELNPVSLLLRHLPLQKLADGLEKP